MYRHKERLLKAVRLFARSINLIKGGDGEKATKCARKCLSIVSSLKIETEGDAAPGVVMVQGVLIPEIFHEETVLPRLKDVGLS